MSDVSLEQGIHVLSVLRDKGIPREQVQKLFTSGLFSDLLDGNLDNVDRDEFRKILGLVELEIDPFVYVDHSRSVKEPYWFTCGFFGEYEKCGPIMYNIPSLIRSNHNRDSNDTEWVSAAEFYKRLSPKMVQGCLSLADGKAIQEKGIIFFRRHFKGKRVFLWRSAGKNQANYDYVPCVFEESGEVVLEWIRFDERDRSPLSLGQKDLFLRFYEFVPEI